MNRFTILLKKIFFGEAIIARVVSSLNGEILIYEDIFGVKRLKVGELTQSGGEMDRIMKLAFSEVCRARGDVVNHILMLGLGAGTWIKQARKRWPKAQITIIEFDPVMIQIAKQYFGFENNDKVNVIQVDAFDWLTNQEKSKNPIKYDLVVVDLYLGINFPTYQTQNLTFTHQIKHLITTNGIVAINRLNWWIHREETDKFQQFYENQFATVWTKKTLSNRIIFCTDESH